MKCLRSSQETAVLLYISLYPFTNEASDQSEVHALLVSAGLIPVATMKVSPRTLNARYLIGKGKLDECRTLVQTLNPSVLIVSECLTPAQQRNLEKDLCCKVLDRTGLILDIFAQRARTFEGRLQVELAQLQYLSTRLIRGWTHLERQKGGIGLRGPGETQLETDRRLIHVRIQSIQRQLQKVRQQRALGRQRRQKTQVPTVALVGYTNAGKSSLFNALCDENIYVEDQLFATLDPTIRRIHLAQMGPMVLVDTVGFIRGLPHQLVEAFKATLEEVLAADLLLHVVDCSAPDYLVQMKSVEQVLAELGADHKATLYVFNKLDALPAEQAGAVRARIAYDSHNQAVKVWISVRDALGLDLLAVAIKQRLVFAMIHCCVRLTMDEWELRSSLYTLKAVMDEHSLEDGSVVLELKLAAETFFEFFPQNTY